MFERFRRIPQGEPERTIDQELLATWKQQIPARAQGRHEEIIGNDTITLFALERGLTRDDIAAAYWQAQQELVAELNEPQI